MNEINELSKLSKLNKLTKYLLEVDADIWDAFKLISISQGLKVKEAIKQALLEYIENHKGNYQNIEIKIIENKEAKENILQVIYEEEIRDILKELINAKQRKANISYINDLKTRLFDLLKKNSVISKELAEEVKITLKNLKT
ncbi:MAG: hypothetical protein RMI79_06250 [Nitrososphaerota archaeon]|nr:hypothetical protein [Nitrososphaerota archaeon]